MKRYLTSRHHLCPVHNDISCQDLEKACHSSPLACTLKVLFGLRDISLGVWSSYPAQRIFYLILLDSVSPRANYILFSTRSPPAIQRIPWPQLSGDDERTTRPVSRDFKYYDTWVLNDEELPWLMEPDGTFNLYCVPQASAN